VSAQEELARSLPVIRELANAEARVSVVAKRSTVVEAAAALVNDVSGGLADLATPRVPMHWRAHSTSMQAHTFGPPEVGLIL